MMVQIQDLANAVSSIPHIGQVLGVALTIAAAIHRELTTLDSKLDAEMQLGTEATSIIRDISMYSQNLLASDPVHLERLAIQMKSLVELADEIKRHISEASCARQRHIRKYGNTLADSYECVVESANVDTLSERLIEAKSQLKSEFEWIKMMEGSKTTVTEPPPYTAPLYDQKTEEAPFAKRSDNVRWVRRQALDEEPDLRKLMVPVCSEEKSEDGALWYIARVPHINGIQPGKYKPGVGAFFGHRREVLEAINLEFDVLVAEPDSVRWVPMSGRFSEERLWPARPVKGCRENSGTELVVARAWAREHMRMGIFTEKTLRPGKASPHLECAYVTAGKEEKAVEDYEVLVHA